MRHECLVLPNLITKEQRHKSLGYLKDNFNFSIDDYWKDNQNEVKVGNEVLITDNGDNIQFVLPLFLKRFIKKNDLCLELVVTKNVGAHRDDPHYRHTLAIPLRAPKEAYLRLYQGDRAIEKKVQPKHYIHHLPMTCEAQIKAGDGYLFNPENLHAYRYGNYSKIATAWLLINGISERLANKLKAQPESIFAYQ